MNKDTNQNNSSLLWIYSWLYSNKKLTFRRHFLLIFAVGLLFIPYFIFTLPGSFLMGSFCNRQKKMKIGFSFVGYFLLLVGICMIAPILNYWNLIPIDTNINIAIIIGKIWDIFAILGILIMIASAVSDSFGVISIVRLKKITYLLLDSQRISFRNKIA